MNNLKRLILSTMLMFCCSILFAQTECSGTIVDANGDPIIGASVIEKGTSNGIVTDIDGNFKLNVKQGSLLIISYIGYVTQDVKAAPNLKITLKEDRLHNAKKSRFDRFCSRSFNRCAQDFT